MAYTDPNQVRPEQINSAPIDVEGYLRAKQGEAAENKALVDNAFENLQTSKVMEQPEPLPEFQPGPGMAAPPAATQNPYSLEDFAKMIGGMESPAAVHEASRGPSGMEALMIGATPLLVDLLTGGNSGNDIAANYLQKASAPDPDRAKKSTELEIQRMKLFGEKIRAMKTMAGTGVKGSRPLGKNNWGTFLDPKTNKRVSGTYDQAAMYGWTAAPESNAADLVKSNQMGTYWDPAIGKEVSMTHSEGIARQLRLVGKVDEYNKTTAIDKQLDRESREKIAGMQREAMVKNGASKKEVAAFDKFVSKGSKYNTAEQDVWATKNAMDILNKGGIIGEGGIPTMVAKSIFKEVGNLSETDLKMAKGSPAISAMAQRWAGRAFDGQPLRPEDRKDLAILFKVAYNHSANKARIIADRTKKGYKAMGMEGIGHGIDAYVNIPELPDLTDAVPATPSMGDAPAAQAPNRANNSLVTPPASGSVTVTRKSDGVSVQMDPSKAKTLDPKKYSIGK
jgi:hypothetical protein